jgi:MFS family permease
VARPLPFAVAALVILGAIGGFVVLILRRGSPPQDYRHAEAPAQVARRLVRLIRRHRALRAFFFANALWETTLSALKAFIVLYMTLGLGYSLQASSLLIGGVALVILIGAAGSGKLGDKFGRIRIITIALVGYGAGYLIPIFTTSRPAIAASIPFIALGGGTVMTMAYALLMPLMPEDEHGALTGFYSISRGVGIVIGPIIAGALIWFTRDGLFKATHGFQAMWIVCAASSFASLYFLRRMANAAEDRRRLEANDAGG